MKTITGKLIGLTGCAGSGIGTVTVLDAEGTAHRAHIEAGFGVRQLLQALGGDLQTAPIATYTIDSLGIVFSVASPEPETDND